VLELRGDGRDAAAVRSDGGQGRGARATVIRDAGGGAIGGAAMTRPRRRSKVEAITAAALHPAAEAEPNRKPSRDLERDTTV